MNPTTEQKYALDLFSTGKSLAIEAGAGAGKTSTLKLLAQSTNRRGQYIAFNKPIVLEAKEKMPKTVECSTAHSLAHRSVMSGTPFIDRLRSSKRMKSTEIADRLRIDAVTITLPEDGGTKVLARTYLAGLAMRGITSFCQSVDAQPEAKHVPYINGIDVPPGNRTNNNVVAKSLVSAMRRAWKDITDENGELPFKHDYYLKMWHLSGPTIHADYILFDEAQDANPVLVDIVRQQAARGVQLVWVGDSQQQIYTFTGAVNALQTVGAEQEAYLTQSFRFGPAIAAVANDILGRLNAKLTLTGTESIPSVVEPLTDPDVILCRTNATAVTNLLEAIREEKRTHIVGGGSEVIDFAKAAKSLMDDGFTAHPELACFSSWGEVQTYVEQDEQGGDLRLMTKLVDDFGVDTIVEALEGMPEQKDADLVISTAHKSKGREWDTVKLAADFPPEPKGEELRLLYVAVTRAKLALDVTNTMLTGVPVPAVRERVSAPVTPKQAPKAPEATPKRSAAQNGSQRLTEGTQAIVGTVMSTKTNKYGLLVLLKLDGGCRVMGPVPRGLDDQMTPGTKLSLTADVTPDSNDPTFGFYRRPKGAEVQA